VTAIAGLIAGAAPLITFFIRIHFFRIILDPAARSGCNLQRIFFE